MGLERETGGWETGETQRETQRDWEKKRRPSREKTRERERLDLSEAGV